MTVLVVAPGSAGDVHPNVGLALELQRRGHRVILMAAVIFAPLAQRVGLPFEGYGTEEEWREILRNPDLWHPLRAFPLVARHLMLPLVRPVYERIAQLQAEDPHLVVAGSGLVLGARIAQEKLGVPVATVHLQPSLIRSLQEPAVLGFPDILGWLPMSLRDPYLKLVDSILIDRLLCPEVNAFRAELSLPPVKRIFDRWIHSPQLVIGFFPEWYAPPQPDWPPHVHLTGFPRYDESDTREVPADLEAFLRGGEPPVVFTAGSANAQGGEFFRVSAEACRKGGWRGILLTQFPEQLPPNLPDTVRHFDYVPFSQVLPQAAAFVHHGGIGTTAQALAAGVPQLVVPMSHDQPDNATRVCRLGVGDMLRPKHYRIDAVLDRLSRLMGSNAVAENCRRRAAGLTTNTTLEETCKLIELLGDKRSSK